jgi:integrase
MFEAQEIHRMLEAAGVQLRAMILLAINAGFGNHDCGNLPWSALDLKTGWVNYPRPKTGIPRRCALWPETVKAIEEVRATRPTPKKSEHAELVFITQRGGAWAKDICDSPITKETRKLLDSLGIDGERNFYCLRHTFETIGGESCDQVGVNSIMGHADASMAAAYRERVSDQRLLAVTEYVRRWLFREAGGN